MLIVILLYDQLLFRPLVAWADRFRVEQEPGARAPRSWVLTMLRRARPIGAGWSTCSTPAFAVSAAWAGRAAPAAARVHVAQSRPRVG